MSVHYCSLKSLFHGEPVMSDLDNIKELSLYHFIGCPYCATVRVFIDQFDLAIEQKDILSNLVYRNELLKYGGKTQVPCLRVRNHKGETNWMYESESIIDYLCQINQQLAAIH